ncbi:MAG: hypothetical protein U1F08_00635 [Steroidobacteraceae bacterium]
MSNGRKKKKAGPARKPAEQAELPLPPPPGPPLPVEPLEYAWWQKPSTVAGLAVVAVLCVTAGIAGKIAADRARAHEADMASEVRRLTLRAAGAERAVRIAPNPRSWSATPDATLDWPDPPQLLELYLPVGYANFPTYGITIDKVDHGRLLAVQRMVPDSNQELRLALNSSAFGPGEYRIRIEGHDRLGERVDAGWVRLVVQ